MPRQESGQGRIWQNLGEKFWARQKKLESGRIWARFLSYNTLVGLDACFETTKGRYKVYIAMWGQQVLLSVRR